jgi:RNA polymerase sigma factor (sigma-70 family)
MKTVTNEDFEKALLNVDNIRIIKSVVRKFRIRLGASIAKQCGNTALWMSLMNFDDTKGCKYTTYLYRTVFWTCLNEVRYLNKEKAITNVDVCYVRDSITSKTFKHSDTSSKDIFDILGDVEARLLKARYVNQNTLSEISISNNMTEKRVRKSLREIIKKIKSTLT